MRSPTTPPLSSRLRRRLLSPRLDPLVLVNRYSVSKPPILLALPDYKRLPRSFGTLTPHTRQTHYASHHYTITYEDNDVERVPYVNMKRVVPGTAEYIDHQSIVTALHVAFIAAATDASSAVNSDVTPNSYKEARASLEVAGWQQSMDEEMANLRKLSCRTVIPRSSLPPNTPVMGTRWTYRKKTDANGTFTRYRGRLVAKFSESITSNPSRQSPPSLLFARYSHL